MRPRWIAGITLVALTLTWPVVAETCTDIPRAAILVTDPAGDSIILSETQDPLPGAHPAVDLLGMSLQSGPASLDIRLVLAARPPNESTRTYRYWLGFDVDNDTGSRPVEIRLGLTTTYDSAVLVGPNEAQNPTLSRLPVTWNGSEMQMSIPWLVLRGFFGPGLLTITSPIALSEGESLSPYQQGPENGAIFNDILGSPGSPTASIQLGTCAAKAPETPAAASARGLPPTGAAFLVAAALVGAGLRRRRA